MPHLKSRTRSSCPGFDDPAENSPCYSTDAFWFESAHYDSNNTIPCSQWGIFAVVHRVCRETLVCLMRLRCGMASVAVVLLIQTGVAGAEDSQLTRPLRYLDKDYFPFAPVKNAAEWEVRRETVQRRLMVAAGLFPMPKKSPLNPVVYGRIVKEDYTVEKVIFESLPGHFVTGNLYLPKTVNGKIPAVICPHGHWPGGRFMHADDAEVKKQIAMGAEKFDNAARSPLQARCVQLARMGCAVFFYDMLGFADSVQVAEHQHRPQTKGLVSPDAELNLVSCFGLQTWNSERAVDFISSLPFVDSTRIGCTGASGGGTQTMIISGIDDRIAAAFPCVMVSSAMQGGCICENADYLRINQGNIDIVALTAPRPLGMTAANDWTKELETKGFPDLKNLYAQLGVPERVEAHYNLQFPHNYNAVSRSQMYSFFNHYFKLGIKNTEERDFQILSTPELSVWNESHPKPTGQQVGESHEVSIVNWFKAETSRQMAPLLQPKSTADLMTARAVVGGAFEVMIGRSLPKEGEIVFAHHSEESAPEYNVQRGTGTSDGYAINTTLLYPKQWNHSVILWLSLKGEKSLIDSTGKLSGPAERMLKKGYAVACPQLYLPDALQNPHGFTPVPNQPEKAFKGSAVFYYGYNSGVFAERVRDALALIAIIRDDKSHPADHISVAGVEGAGIVAAAATALSTSTVNQLACDTGGFRFARLDNIWDVNFLPGAAKYGDVPALLSLCAPVKTTVIGENQASAAGVADTFSAAKGRVDFLSSPQVSPLDLVVNALIGSQ